MSSKIDAGLARLTVELLEDGAAGGLPFLVWPEIGPNRFLKHADVFTMEGDACWFQKRISPEITHVLVCNGMHSTRLDL